MEYIVVLYLHIEIGRTVVNSVYYPDSDSIRSVNLDTESGYGIRIRIQIQECKNETQK